MLILKPFLCVSSSHISTQPLAGGKAGGFEWTVTVSLLFSKAWSYRLAEGSTNICEMDQGEQGRERTMCVVPGPSPDAPSNQAWICSFNYQAVCAVTCGLGHFSTFSLMSDFLLGSKKAHWQWHSEEVYLSAVHAVHALQEGSLPEILPSP